VASAYRGAGLRFFFFSEHQVNTFFTDKGRLTDAQTYSAVDGLLGDSGPQRRWKGAGRPGARDSRVWRIRQARLA